MFDTKTISTRHRNNFDALRLFAAVIVICGHGQDLTGGRELGLWNAPLAKLGLDIFFCISGYLVTRSWERNADPIGFAIKRALRLMPGLIACVLLMAFVVGPIATTLPLGEYFGRWHTWSYLLNIALYLQLVLPGVFDSLPRTSAVNGSLWSLFPEVLCYATVPALARLPSRMRKAFLLAGGCAAGIAALYLFRAPHAPVIEFYGLYMNYGLQELPFFFGGAFLSLVDRERPGFYRIIPAIVLFAGGCGLSAVYGWLAVPLEWLLLPYLVIGLGQRSFPILNKADAAGDLSYGLYLYAFPVQQLLGTYLPRLSHPIVACVLMTLPVAWLSWHFVEQPMLRLGGQLKSLRQRLGHAATQADAWTLAGLRAAPGLWRTPALPLAIGLVIVLAYLGQLQMGRWQSDEYMMLTNQRLWGWHILPVRLGYSPRPFSEAILFAYDWIVLHLNRPLVAPFLGALWIGALAAASVALFASLPRGPWRVVVALALPTAIFGFVLTTSEITEFFFWPVAAAAYIPTAAASLLLLFLLSRPRTAARDLACGTTLLMTAFASEMGAAFTMSFGAAALVEAVLPGRTQTTHIRRTGRDRAAGTLWWLVPMLAGAAVFLQIARNRANVVEFDATSRPLYDHPALSTWAALAQMWHETFSLGLMSDGLLSVWAVTLKVALAVGVVGVWAWASHDGVRLRRFGPVLAAGLLGAAFFSLWGAFMHYGVLCCERQSTTRFWMTDVLAIIAATYLLPRGFPRARWAAPVLLTVALCPVLWRVGGIREDYVNLHYAREARMKTWVSAAKPDTHAMQFYLPPDGATLLIRGTSQPIGRVVVGENASDMTNAVGRFFDRQVIDVCQPWQSAKSLLYYGRLIPACPPHGGPPDGIYPDPADTQTKH